MNNRPVANLFKDMCIYIYNLNQKLLIHLNGYIKPIVILTSISTIGVVTTLHVTDKKPSDVISFFKDNTDNYQNRPSIEPEISERVVIKDIGEEFNNKFKVNIENKEGLLFEVILPEVIVKDININDEVRFYNDDGNIKIYK